jgi:hypothetical protein
MSVNDWNDLEEYQRLALAQKKLRIMELREAFDPLKLESRPTEEQAKILKDQADYDVTTQIVQGGNQSGKSLTVCNVVAKFFNLDHPYLDIKRRWGGEPITILFLSQNSKQYENHWEKRVEPFLEPGTYRPVTQGNSLQTVKRLDGMAKILFFTYDNPKSCAKIVQSYDAHLVVMDELCNYLPLFEELDKRIMAKDGIIMYAFSAKRPARRVRKYLYAEDPYKRRYILDTLDNPVYDERKKKKIWAKINALPADVRDKYIDASLRGGWFDDGSYVYSVYDPVRHLLEKAPEWYSRSRCRHVCSVDPAAAGKAGYILVAENPDNPDGEWVIVKAKYLPGDAPSDLVEAVEEENDGYNIVLRIADSHETGFIKEARKIGINYRQPHKKNRKTELIDNSREAFKLGWMTLMPIVCEELEDELETAEWCENDPYRIQNSKNYHLLDATQYFVDLKPHWVGRVAEMDALVALDLANKARKKREIAAKNKGRMNKIQILRRGRSKLWRRRRA